MVKRREVCFTRNTSNFKPNRKKQLIFRPEVWPLRIFYWTHCLTGMILVNNVSHAQWNCWPKIRSKSDFVKLMHIIISFFFNSATLWLLDCVERQYWIMDSIRNLNMKVLNQNPQLFRIRSRYKIPTGNSFRFPNSIEKFRYTYNEQIKNN